MTRTLYWLLGIAAVLAVFLRDPLLVLLALLLGLLAGLTALWDRYALAAVTYERHLASTRLFAGEATDLTIVITNAEGVIEYLGQTDDIRPHLHAADCVVLPSAYREGVPRSLLEAAAIEYEKALTAGGPDPLSSQPVEL